MEFGGKHLGWAVGAGLRLSTAGGSIGGQSIRPGISVGSLGPKWVGEMMASFPSNSPLSQGPTPSPLIP